MIESWVAVVTGLSVLGGLTVIACSWVQATEATRQWALENAGSIQRKREGYFTKWTTKPEEGKPTLAPEDGF